MYKLKEEIALWRAAKSCNAEKLHQLVSNELDEDVRALLNKPHPAKGTTPLMVAATRKYGTETVRALINLGADLNVTDTGKHQNTALHYAAYNNRVVQLDLLLEAGANLFALNGKGHTALDVARLRGRKEAAAALTSRLQVHSGWLYLRSKSVLGFWKRRWCVVLACNSKRTATEICVFQSPSKVHPEAVMWQDSSTTHCAGQECRISEKSNGFTLDTNVVYQKLRSRHYSRYKSSGRTHVHKANLQPREFVFAYDNESSQVAWMRALEYRQREYTNTTMSSTSTSSMYRSSAGSGGATVDAAPLPSKSPDRKNFESGTQADKLSPLITPEPARSMVRASAPTLIEDENGFVWGDMPASRTSFTSEIPSLVTVITINRDPNVPQPLAQSQCIEIVATRFVSHADM